MMRALLVGIAVLSAAALGYGGYVRLTSLDWSPDGKTWLLVQDDAVWAITPGGEDLRRLTDEGKVVWARFAPDGEHFYYVALHHGYYAVKRGALSGGEAEVVLAEEGTNFYYVAPFPDGKRLAVVCDRGGQQDLWIYDLEAKDFTRVTDTPEPEATPDVSPDGKMIVLAVLGAESWDIYLIASGGEWADREALNITSITEDPFFDWCPRFSPDGKWIAFESNRSGNSDIWITGTERNVFFPFTYDRWRDAFPAWSPDMTALAYGIRRDGESDWIVSFQGTY